MMPSTRDPKKAKKAAAKHVRVKESELAEVMAQLEAEEAGVVQELEQANLNVAVPADAPDARWAVYLQSLKHGSRIGAACRAAGIPYAAVLARRAVDEDFVKAERLAELEASEVVENALHKAAAAGEQWAVLFWLQNRAGDRWADQRRPNRQILHIEGSVKHLVDANESIDRIGDIVQKIEARKRARELNAGVIDAEVVEEAPEA